MQRTWQILLIGGSSGVGKTSIAPLLAQTYDVSWIQADDFRLAMERVTSSEQQPDLHFFSNPANSPLIQSSSPEQLCARLIKLGEVVSHALEIVIANHLNNPIPLIIEGDGILPQLAAQSNILGWETKGKVRAVFLYEPQEAAIFKNMQTRKRGFDDLDTPAQILEMRRSWLYGEWLRQEALNLGLPVLEIQPRATLLKRILAVTT